MLFTFFFSIAGLALTAEKNKKSVCLTLFYWSIILGPELFIIEVFLISFYVFHFIFMFNFNKLTFKSLFIYRYTIIIK
jgi:hypothetical protein